jgi:hypothetical protein
MQRPTFIMIGSRIWQRPLGILFEAAFDVSRSLKVAIKTLAMLALGTPKPPGTGRVLIIKRVVLGRMRLHDKSRVVRP